MSDRMGKVVLVVAMLVALVWQQVDLYLEERAQKEALRRWLDENDLLEFEQNLHKDGR